MNQRSAIGFFIFLIAGTTAGFGQDISRAQLLLARADSLSRAGRFDAADQAYTDVISLAAQTLTRELRADAHFGRAYANHVRFSGSIQAAEPTATDRVVAIRRDYDMATALDSAAYAAPAGNNIGMLLLAVGEARGAVPFFLRAAASNHPNRGRFYANAGEAFEDLGIADSAIWSYQQALTFSTTADLAARRLAGLYALAGLADSVLSVTRQATFKIEHPLYKESLLRILAAQPLLPDAKADSIFMLFARDLMTDSVIDPSHFSRTLGYRLDRVAAMYPSLREPASAIRAATQPLTEKERFSRPAATWWRIPDRAIVWSNILRLVGDHYRWSGRYENAGDFFDAAVEFDSATGRAPDFNIVGAALEAHSQNDNFERVDHYIGLLEALLLRHPNLSNTQRAITSIAYFNAGVAMSAARRFDRALQMNRRALQYEPRFATAMVNAGYIFQVMQEVDSARSYFERAVAIDSTESVGRNNLGFTTYMSGDFAGAIPHLRASYSLQPSLLTAINLGLANRFSGQLQKAREWHQLADSMARIAESTDDPYARGTWVYNYTPLAVSDRVTIRNNVLVDSMDKKRAVARFAFGLDLAISGDTINAAQMVHAATRLAPAAEFRCFFANDVRAALNYLRVVPAITAYLERLRLWLRADAACPT